MRLTTWTLIAGTFLVVAGLHGTAVAQVSGTGQIVVFRLDGPVPESPPEFQLFDLEQRKSLHELIERFRKARKDDTVKAIVLTFDDPRIGWAQMQELRQAIADLRSADKDVYAYLEHGTAGTYQLAASATKVVMPPTGELFVMGMYVEHPYFKGLMDKIGVQADIEHIGSFKTAGEPFTRTGPSEEAQQMTEWLLNDLFDQMVNTIAESRQLTPERVRELIDQGPFTAKQALEARLIDETGYVEDFVRSLEKRYGDVKMVFNYGAKKGPEIDLSSPFAIFKLFSEAMQKSGADKKPSIGVVYVDGMIVPGKTEPSIFGTSGLVGSTNLRRVLNKARDDDSMKAVVLRVDSPGGSAMASDIIWHAAKELADKKPLVVSMGNVAASGGYYVSMGAGTVFADPGTLTGSIGVVGGKIVTKGLWDWAGINWHEHKIGKNAGLMSTNSKWNERERAIIREYMQIVYNEFTGRVKKSRGERLKKDIEELAGGRVYTGKQALALGLVDKLGGLQDAVKFAAASANLSDYETKLLPERKNIFDLMLKSLMGESPDEENVNLRAAGGLDAGPARPALFAGDRNPRFGWTLQSPAIRELIPAIRALDDQKAEILYRSLLRIELLAQEPTLFVLPAEINVR